MSYRKTVRGKLVRQPTMMIFFAIMEEVAKCEASRTSDEYNMATSCLLNHQTIASFMQ